MIRFLIKYWKLISVFIIPFIIFYPSLFVFYTNDDFFFLKISNISNFRQFLNFFSFINTPGGFVMYRPLTTQAFYFLTDKIFNLNPLPLHIISFLFFFGVVLMVYRLVKELFGKEKIALIAAFLYSVSATHFGQLYYLGAFQELGMTLFVLLSIFFSIKYFTGNKSFNWIWAILFFIFAVMSKETAVVAPGLIALVYFYLRFSDRKVIETKKFWIYLAPFVLLLFAYLLVRFKIYGFSGGEGYVWNFIPKTFVNTVGWYIFWSFNIPESLVDFIGPGLTVNANLFRYWAGQMIPIFALVAVQCLVLAYTYVKVLLTRKEKEQKDTNLVSTFSILWFGVTLLPVAFLPSHKFTFYLTLPLIAITIRIAYLFDEIKIKGFFIGLFLILWTATSFLNLKFTYTTNWISQSEIVAKKIFEYFKADNKFDTAGNIYFVDTAQDVFLPWSPTSVVMTVLSNKNFFVVFYPSLAQKVQYIGADKVNMQKNDYAINSRDFLGY